MIEKQTIKGRDVWFKVDPYKVQRSSPGIIPTEYFIVSFFDQEPAGENEKGVFVKDEEGNIKLFESPVAALTYARQKMYQQYS